MTYADEINFENDLTHELEKSVAAPEPTLHDQMTTLREIQRTMQDRIAAARLNLAADYERRRVEVGNHFTQLAHEAALKLQRDKATELDNLRLHYERKIEEINQLEKRMP